MPHRLWHLSLISLFLLLSSFGQGTQTPSRGPVRRTPSSLNAKIGEFSAGGVSRLEALVGLGREYDLPIGVECVRADMFQPAPTVSLHQPTLREAVDAVLPQPQRYRLLMSSGVLLVRCAPELPVRRNVLAMSLPSFSIQRANLATAGTVVSMELQQQLAHRTLGFAGDYTPAPSGHDVGPLHIRAGTVESALNTIVRSYGRAAWVATAPPDKLGRLPSTGLWIILDYRDPRWTDAIQVISTSFKQN